MPSLASSFALVAACGFVAAQSSLDATAFEAGQTAIDGHAYPWRLLAPLPHLRGEPRPLVVFLHGAGERGGDNLEQLRWLPQQMAETSMRAAYPCWLLAVQCPKAERWVDVPWDAQTDHSQPSAPSRAMRAVLAATDALLAGGEVDRARVYLTGLSMGGFGTFDLAARRPELFAAALPVCGGGDPRAAARLVGLPFHIWHGLDDRVVPAQRSQRMVEALQEAGAQVTFHALAGVGHDVWRQAYGGDGSLPWLFAQDQRQQQRGKYGLTLGVPSLPFVAATGAPFVLGTGTRCLVDAASRAAATTFLELLEVPARLQPSLTEAGEARRGDVVFAIDARLGEAFTLVVEDCLRVEAGCERQLGKAAIAAAQLLRREPGWQCARGRVGSRPTSHRNRVVLPEWLATASAATLLPILRECRLFGVDEIVVGWDPPRGEPGTDLLQAAQRLGLLWVGRESLPAEGAVAWTPATGATAAAPLPTSVPVPFVLRVPDAAVTAAAVLAFLQGQLPLASERCQRPSPLHLASLRSRIEPLRR